MVLEVPVPVVVMLPGVLVRVQVPDDGSPVSSTLPVALVQVGWMIEFTVGAAGMGLTVTSTVRVAPLQLPICGVIV